MGDAGVELPIKLRRFAGGCSMAPAGDGQKYEPRPGEPEMDGESLPQRMWRGESTSIVLWVATAEAFHNVGADSRRPMRGLGCGSQDVGGGARSFGMCQGAGAVWTPAADLGRAEPRSRPLLLDGPARWFVLRE